MRVATANGQEELSRKSVSEMRKIIQEMRDDSFSAARGIFNRAKLHDPMFKFLGELDGKLSEISDKIDDRKDDFIKNILERCAQDKIEAEARLAQELQAAEVRHEQELETVQARLDRMEGYVEHLTNLLRQNGIMNQNPMPEERSGTSTHFFARR